MGLSFGMYKCAKLSVSQGKAVQTDDLTVHVDFCIHELNTSEAYNYKYLRFIKREGIECGTTKKIIVAEYEHQLNLIWNSCLNGPRKARVTNSLHVLLVSFGFGIILWTDYPRSAVECLYLPRSRGGRGLVSVENLFHCHLMVLAHHLCSSHDSLVQLCYRLDNLLPPRVSVVTRACTYCVLLSISADWKSWTCSDLKKELRTCEFSQLMDTLVAKLLHGKFQALLSSNGMDSKRSTCWLQLLLHSESK